MPSAGRSLTGFTFIEIFIVIGIIAVLSVVILLVLNPVRLLRQSRDGVRLSDLQAINRALLLYQTDQSSGSFGAASTTYVSLPDPAATTTAGTNCAGMGLPILPSGWNYHCAASSTLRNIDGLGWIPGRLIPNILWFAHLASAYRPHKYRLLPQLLHLYPRRELAPGRFSRIRPLQARREQ